MSDEESPADRDERVMLSHHIDEMHMDDMKDRIVELEAENKLLRDALQDIHDDLVRRADIRVEGPNVVACGFSVWLKVCAALEDKEND